MVKLIPDNASYEDARKIYYEFKGEFNEFEESFSRERDVLKHSKAYDDVNAGYLESDDLLTDMSNIVDIIKGEFDYLDELMSDSKSVEPMEDNWIEHINKLISSHSKLANAAGELKENLPIAQNVKSYSSKALGLISRLCTAVTTFFNKILPDKASKAKSSFDANLDILRDVIQELKAGAKAPKKSGPGGI